MGRARESLVPAAARTAPRHQRPLPGPDEVEPGPVGLDQHLRTWRNRDLQVLAIGAVPQRALAVPTPFRLEMRAAAEAFEIAERVLAHEHNVSAPACVATVGAALRNVGLAPEAEAPIAAGAGLDVYASTIVHVQSLAQDSRRGFAADSGARCPTTYS